MPSTFWVHCSSKPSGKPPVQSRPGKILRGFEAFTSANFKNSSGIRPSAKSSLNGSPLIILRLNRQPPCPKCRNEAVKKRQRGLGLENTGVYVEMLSCYVERRSRLFSVFSDSVRRLLVLC